ncbi:MAG TPA: hypothetical protein DGZ94_11485 [Serratia sp.]|nr:hypothetical protein [Serratia sp. (in: enterobacteria)]
MIYNINLSLRSVLKKVTDAIERHERNEVAPLSIQLLSQVKKELEEMIRIMIFTYLDILALF